MKFQLHKILSTLSLSHNGSTYMLGGKLNSLDISQLAAHHAFDIRFQNLNNGSNFICWLIVNM